MTNVDTPISINNLQTTLWKLIREGDEVGFTQAINTLAKTEKISEIRMPDNESKQYDVQGRNLAYLAISAHQPKMLRHLMDTVKSQGDDPYAYFIHRAKPGQSGSTGFLASSAEREKQQHGVSCYDIYKDARSDHAVRTAKKMLDRRPYEGKNDTPDFLKGIPHGIVGGDNPATSVYMELMPNIVLVDKDGRCSIVPLPEAGKSAKLNEEFKWAEGALNSLSGEYAQLRESSAYDVYRQFNQMNAVIGVTQGSTDLFRQHIQGVPKVNLTFSRTSVGNAQAKSHGEKSLLLFDAEHMSPAALQEFKKEVYKDSGHQNNVLAHELHHAGDVVTKEELVTRVRKGLNNDNDPVTGRHGNAYLFKLAVEIDRALYTEGIASAAYRSTSGYHPEKYGVEMIARVGEAFVVDSNAASKSPIAHAYLEHVYRPDQEWKLLDKPEPRRQLSVLIFDERDVNPEKIFGPELGRKVKNLMEHSDRRTDQYYSAVQMARREEKMAEKAGKIWVPSQEFTQENARFEETKANHKKMQAELRSDGPLLEAALVSFIESIPSKVQKRVRYSNELFGIAQNSAPDASSSPSTNASQMSCFIERCQEFNRANNVRPGSATAHASGVSLQQDTRDVVIRK